MFEGFIVPSRKQLTIESILTISLLLFYWQESCGKRHDIWQTILHNIELSANSFTLKTMLIQWIFIYVKQMHCLQKGPYFEDVVLNKDLFGILGPYWVLIYISGSLFSLFWFHSRKEYQFSHICRHWFRFTLLENFDFYLHMLTH